MKNLLTAAAIGLGCLTLITACGGGSSGSGTNTNVSRNATLDSTDDAARVLAAFALTQNIEGPGQAFEAFGQDDVCNRGGDTNGSSLSGNTINITFNNCDTRVSDNTQTIDTLLNGDLKVTCNDSIAVCNNISATVGKGSTPLMADVQIQENGSTTADLVSELRGDIKVVMTQAANTERTITTSDMIADIQDERNNISYKVVADDLEVDITDNTDTGASSTTVSGAFSLSGLPDCTNGGIEVTTISPIEENADGDTLSGEIEFSNNSGQVSTVEFLNPDGVRITANGNTRTYTGAELAAFCN